MRTYRLVPMFLVVALTAGASLAKTEAAPDTAATFDLRIVSTSIGNLFYQLECVAKRLRCSERAYREFWALTGFDDSDEASVRRFADTLARYDTRAQLGQGSPAPENASRFGPEITDVGPLASQSISLLSRIRIAAYDSSDVDDLLQRLGLLMQPTDVDIVEVTILRFRSRFDGWWDSNPAAARTRFAHGLHALLGNELAGLMPAILDFYALDRHGRGARPVAHLMPHPTESGQANGTIIENHAVLEIVKDEEPRDRVGVLVHELSHYFFASAPIEWHAMRLEGALRAGGPRAAAALALMNEALATAIGNGVLEQRLRGEDFKAFFDRPQSFYATEDVDAAAKAILPLMRDYLADRRSLDRAFVDRYFSLVIARLGGQLDSLEARLRVSAYVAADAGLYATMNEAARWLDTRSLWHSPPGDVSLEDAVLTRHGYLNGVVLTSMRDRLRFSRLVPDIERLNPVPGSAAIACTSARHSGSTLYVVVTNGAGLSSRSLIALLEQARPCQEDSAVNSAPRPFPG